MSFNRPLTVVVEDGELRISIGIDTLAYAIEMNPDQGDEQRFVITDNAEFADGVAAALQEEEEDGTTPVHLLFDAAAQAAIEAGASGIGLEEGS